MNESAVKNDRRMTVREVAEALGCNPETIKGHIRELWPDLVTPFCMTYLNEAQITVILERIKQTTAAHRGAESVNLQRSVVGMEATHSQVLRIMEHEGRQTVNARELHEALGVGRDFSTWIKDRIEKYGFSEGLDYQKAQSPNLGTGNNAHTGGSPSVVYVLSLSMAKEIAMVENNEKGREIRQYLIKVEEAWNSPALIMARALQVSQKQIENYQQEISVLKPKAEFFDTVADSKDALQMRDVAGILNMPGWGRNSIFDFLRKKGILDDRNVPYREYQDRGYFRVIEQKWTDKEGDTRISLKTLVCQRGVDFIRKLVREAA